MFVVGKGQNVKVFKGQEHYGKITFLKKGNMYLFKTQKRF